MHMSVLICLTTCPDRSAADRFDALRERLPQLHPYELPELVAVESVDGLPAYLHWVRDETRPAP